MNDSPRPVTGDRRVDWYSVFRTSREPGALTALVALAWFYSLIA